MMIEVRGTGTHNKGAELMLCAIRQRLARSAPMARLAVESTFGPYADRARYGLWTKIPRRGRGRAKLIATLMTPSYRRNLGLVADREIEAVLDASGLAFSDQWGSGPTEKLAADSRVWRQRGIPSVLLPQAFGPFENPRIREAMSRVVENVSLIFARDAVSWNYLTDLCPETSKIRQAPDFTNIVSPCDTSEIELPDRCAAIVPNVRMLDRAGETERSGYIPFLIRCIRCARALGLSPVMVFHAPADDRQLADLVDREMETAVPRISESCPVRLKSLLSRSEVVVGSRFHALVGALSSGVPSLATSWNHKYAALFEEYGCQEFVVTSAATEDEICSRLTFTTAEPSRSTLRTSLLARSQELCAQTTDMFSEVERTIGIGEFVCPAPDSQQGAGPPPFAKVGS